MTIIEFNCKFVNKKSCEKNLFHMQYSALPDVLRAKGNIKYGYYEKIRFIPYRSDTRHGLCFMQ